MPHFNKNKSSSFKVEKIDSKYGLWSFDKLIDIMIYNEHKTMFDDIETLLVLIKELDDNLCEKDSIEYKFISQCLEIKKKKLAEKVDEFVKNISELTSNIKKKYNII